MNFVEEIREKIGRLVLRQKMKGVVRVPKVYNFQSAQKIGILYFVEDERTYKFIKQFIKDILEEGVRDVIALGFVGDREMPHYIAVNINTDFFTNKDLNWFKKPSSPYITNFIENEFDILIDLSLQDIFPLTYVLGASNAQYKVGKGIDAKQHLLDFMLNIEKTKGIEFLIEQINHYLSTINSIK